MSRLVKESNIEVGFSKLLALSEKARRKRDPLGALVDEKNIFVSGKRQGYIRVYRNGGWHVRSDLMPNADYDEELSLKSIIGMFYKAADVKYGSYVVLGR